MNQLQSACAIAGGQAALSRQLGVTAAAVNQWIKGLRPVPPRHCVSIELATKGAVTRQDLRPNDWQLIWPELTPKQKEVAHG
ncbi:transcriptional regulator [Comamonas sp. 4034]|uniref:transcriptional regulator n=1 Tax=Comamonas sp. 4034 TaxID=3156455 RepID=UPI003D210AE3